MEIGRPEMRLALAAYEPLLCAAWDRQWRYDWPGGRDCLDSEEFYE